MPRAQAKSNFLNAIFESSQSERLLKVHFLRGTSIRGTSLRGQDDSFSNISTQVTFTRGVSTRARGTSVRGTFLQGHYLFKVHAWYIVFKSRAGEVHDIIRSDSSPGYLYVLNT